MLGSSVGRPIVGPMVVVSAGVGLLVVAGIPVECYGSIEQSISDGDHIKIIFINISTNKGAH